VKFKIVLRIMSLKDRTIPVFIYPHELTFYVDNQATHKQLLTLYNPYDFPVKYQGKDKAVFPAKRNKFRSVYANTTDKYLVVDPKGSIAAHAYVDLLIRHIAPIQSKCHSRDKFMITMQDATTNHLLGKRCVLATLLPGDRDSSSTGEESTHSYRTCEPNLSRDRSRGNDTEPSVKNYFILLSVVFIIILILPTKYEEVEETSIPSYLHIALPVKLIVSYILGLITMALLRPC
jgi:hypothetical protein